MNKPTTWVTYYRVPLPDGRVALVQKSSDGCSRTVLATDRSEMVTTGHSNPGRD